MDLSQGSFTETILTARELDWTYVKVRRQKLLPGRKLGSSAPGMRQAKKTAAGIGI
jgi:hypothetical protein